MKTDDISYLSDATADYYVFLGNIALIQRK